MDKKRVVVVCPEEGHTQEKLQVILINMGKLLENIYIWMDQQRDKENLQSISSLDLGSFKSKIHMVGENASTLIFACSMSDYLSIDQKI